MIYELQPLDQQLSMNRLHSHKPILPIKEFVLSPRVLSSLYNATLNVFWSLLTFAPVSIFCYRFMEGAWLSAFVVASPTGFMVPASMLRYLELSPTAATYRKLGGCAKIPSYFEA